MATATLNPNIRSTGNVNTSMHVRDVASAMAWLEPDATVLTAVSLAAGKKRYQVSNPKHEWIEQRRIADFTQVAAQAAASAAATTITLDDGAILVAGDVLSNLTSGENARVVSVSGNVATVVREIGGPAVTWTVDDYVMVLAPAYSEDSENPDKLSRESEMIYNYAQLQRHNWALTDIQKLTKQYGNMTDWEVRQREQVMKDAIAREKTALWGMRDIEAGGTFPIRHTGGVFYFLDQSGSGAAVRPSVGTLTVDTLNLWTEDLFRYDASEKLCLVGSRALTAFGAVARANETINVSPDDDSHGLTIMRYRTPHGVLKLVNHRLFGQNAATTGLALALTMKNFNLFFMGSQFTELRQNIQTPGKTVRENGLITIWGTRLQLPETHGYMSGITGGA